MKRIKVREKISISLSENIREYLDENFENKSRYIEYLIYEDLLKNNAIDKKEYYSYDKNM